jgi:hypothetical protein
VFHRHVASPALPCSPDEVHHHSQMRTGRRCEALKQESRVLERKALASLTWAVEAFNSPHNDGRVTRVLLHLQHAFEMR